MKKIHLKAKSSSGFPYDLTFTNTGSAIIVFCPCEAGVHGKLCKHKIRLMCGDESMLYDPAEANTLGEIRQWVSQCQLDALLLQYDAAKQEIETAKRKEQKMRQEIERALREGIPFKEK
jgi:hypothetical protein